MAVSRFAASPSLRSTGQGKINRRRNVQIRELSTQRDDSGRELRCRLVGAFLLSFLMLDRWWYFS
jgi:hypothetical protein